MHSHIMRLIFLDKRRPFFYIQPVQIFPKADVFQAAKKIKAEQILRTDLLEPIYG